MARGTEQQSGHAAQWLHQVEEAHAQKLGAELAEASQRRAQEMAYINDPRQGSSRRYGG